MRFEKYRKSPGISLGLVNCHMDPVVLAVTSIDYNNAVITKSLIYVNVAIWLQQNPTGKEIRAG